MGHTQLTHEHLFHHMSPLICHHRALHPRYTIEHFLLSCDHLRHHRRSIVDFAATRRLHLDLASLLGDDSPELHDLLFQFLADASIIDNI